MQRKVSTLLFSLAVALKIFWRRCPTPSRFGSEPSFDETGGKFFSVMHLQSSRFVGDRLLPGSARL